MNILSVFDGMSCGRLALEKAGIKVDNYIASEVKDFAIAHTGERYPDTIKAGDITKLHYEGNKLYRDCRRWAVLKNINVMSDNDKERNGLLVSEIEGIKVIDIVNCVFLELDNEGQEKKYDFDKHNQILANYKDSGLVVKANEISEEELAFYTSKGFVVLPNNEIVKWEVNEDNCVFEGAIDMLIGGSPCQDFSFASSSNGGKYGLEGSKSRLFFDYLRVRQEVNPRYFFLENVAMKKDSEAALNEYMGVEGIHCNSKDFSMQQRRRVYWTNIIDNASFELPDIEEETINYQNYKIVTLPYIEKLIYNNTRKAFRSSNTTEKFEFITKKLNDLLFNSEINAIVELNKWAYEEYTNTYPEATKRDFVNELHYQLCEVQVQKTPSRDKMYYIQCKNVTNEKKISCITRKQDRQNNSGNVDFGDYYRFLTRFELCKGQTVPYRFLNDLRLNQIEDVCGDGWTVDVIAHFFGYLPEEYKNRDINGRLLNNFTFNSNNLNSNRINTIEDTSYTFVFNMEGVNKMVEIEDVVEQVTKEEESPKKRGRRSHLSITERIERLEAERQAIDDKLVVLYKQREEENEKIVLDLIHNSGKSMDEILKFFSA